MYTVYKHTCPNGKVYIGIAKNPIVRWGKDGKGYRAHVFYRAIQKYGWDNIKHEILYTDLSHDEACAKEIELIVEYKSNQKEFGYNCTAGGDGGDTWTFNPRRDDFCKKASERYKGKGNPMYGVHRYGKDNPMYGKHFSNESKVKMSNSMKGKNSGIEHYKRRIVICIETNEIFECIKFAKEKYGACHSAIAKACKTGGSAHGFHWRYADE